MPKKLSVNRVKSAGKTLFNTIAIGEGRELNFPKTKGRKGEEVEKILEDIMEEICGCD